MPFLVDKNIKALTENGSIRWLTDSPEDYIEPASVDLPVFGRWAILRSAVHSGENLFEQIEHNALTTGTLKDEGLLIMPRTVYLLEIGAHMNLPPYLSGFCSPKSTAGRCGLICKFVNESEGYDLLPLGYKGAAYLLVYSMSFPVHLKPGDALMQLRLWEGPLSGKKPLHTQNLHLCLSSSSPSDIVAWSPKSSSHVIPWSTKGALSSALFWDGHTQQSIQDSHGLFLPHDGFFLLRSQETVTVQAAECAEMIEYDPVFGEIRGHYAGFFDPGFGVEEESRAVLEVKNLGMPATLLDGQRVSRLNFFALTETPDSLYSTQRGSHYDGQLLRLPRQFKTSASNS